MGRRLLILGIFLLAGAVVNVAVAWGCRLAFRGPQRYSLAYQPSDASTTAWWAWWDRNKPEGVTDDLAGFFSMERFVGWSVVTLHGDEGRTFRVLPSGQIRTYGPMQELRSVETSRGWFFENGPDVDVHRAMYLTAGLPMRSFHGQSWFRTGAMLQQSGIITTGTRVRLPFAPIWPGVIINTLFYAAVLWLLICGPALRRFIRVRRGLCPKCAYPMGESDVCTECGKALRRAAT